MSYQEQLAAFRNPDMAHRPIAYLEFPDTGIEEAKTILCDQILTLKNCGCGGIIPRLSFDNHELNSTDIAKIREMYGIVLGEAKKYGLQVGFYLDPAFEHLVVRTMYDAGETDLCAKLLDCRERICTAGETVNRPLHEGTLLSLVAFSEESCKILDLRSCISGQSFSFKVPPGNWVIREYLAVDDTERKGANYLSFDASFNYICAVFALFSDVFSPYLGNTLSLLCYSGIGFNGLNRRSWDAAFNTLFKQRFGMDPAPMYPALFGYIGENTPHVKAMMMTVRASLIQNGIMKALMEFCNKHGLCPFGNLSEPKLTACSFAMGDALLNNSYSPCALFNKAYLYGTNSVKIAAGAAYNFGDGLVNGELFRNYKRHDSSRLYKDAMNAYARGVNRTALHLPEELTENGDFCRFASRVQTLLQQGTHVADIALLYPIYFLHSQVNLYFSKAEGYEYPATPSAADYMTLINSVYSYAGHDLTVLHPETLNTKCHTEDGILYLDNGENSESFRVVILPSCNVISLKNLRILHKFYDEGGKILATGELPSLAFEYDPTGENDREVREIVRLIFGNDACNKRIMRDFCHNGNSSGGESLFLYFNDSTVDGTKMTKSSTVNEALNSFGVPFDVYLPGMPRFECTGALNSIFPEFRTIHLNRTVPGGGMFNHIHKKLKNADLYYFSNTTDLPYNHHVLLRGVHRVEEWDPHSGEVRPRETRFFSFRGVIYSYLRLTLSASASVFFYAEDSVAHEEDIRKIDSIEHLRSEQSAWMSEF